MKPAKTKNLAILLPYISPITSVIKKTIGKEKTATDRCESNKNGIILSPKVLAANKDVKYNVSARINFLKELSDN